MILQLVYWTVLAASAAFVFWRGGTPEKAGVAIIGIGSVLSVIATSELEERFRSMEWGILLVDVAVLVALLAVALRSDRFWPLWAAGFHVIGVVTHVATLVDPDIVSYAYALAQGFWAYPMLAAVVIGTWNWHKRISRQDDARSC